MSLGLINYKNIYKSYPTIPLNYPLQGEGEASHVFNFNAEF